MPSLFGTEGPHRSDSPDAVHERRISSIKAMRAADSDEKAVEELMTSRAIMIGNAPSEKKMRLARDVRAAESDEAALEVLVQAEQK